MAVRATIIDIKKRTGLSLATISKYLNGRSVRPENKKKIEEAIEALHYHVNENARSLVTSRTRTIGLIVFSVESLFAGIMTRHIGDALRAEGYDLIICDSNTNPETELRNVRNMIKRSVDGIILMPVQNDPGILRLAAEAGVPVVCLDRRIDGMGCDSVTLDNISAAVSLTRLMLDHGHRRIAFIGSEKLYTGFRRLEGYKRAMKGAGLPPDPDLIYLDELSLGTGYHGMKQMLKVEERPTAVVSGNYDVTLGIIMALYEAGLSYPADISLAGFDNLLLADIARPRITVADQPISRMAYEAVRLVLSRITDPDTAEQPPREIVFPASILIRESINSLDL